MFGITSDAYGGTRIVMPEPSGEGNPSPERREALRHDRVSVDPARIAWRSMADRAITIWARSGREFSAYDMVAAGDVDEPPSAAMWGPRFSSAARRGVIRRTGYGPSRRPTVAGSAVAYWQGI